MLGKVLREMQQLGLQPLLSCAGGTRAGPGEPTWAPGALLTWPLISLFCALFSAIVFIVTPVAGNVLSEVL